MSSLTGYRTLQKRDFQASDLGAFGLFGHHKVMLARKPVKRLFYIGFARQKFIDLQIVTAANKAERAAVTALVRYFDIFGREIEVDGRVQYQEFFADPADKVETQRLWIERPKGAVFALLRMQRAVKKRRIGLDARLVLQKREPRSLSDGEVLATRDRKELEDALAAARYTQDRAIAQLVFKRLIFLWQDPAHIQDHFLMMEASELVLEFHQLLGKKVPFFEGEDKEYQYDQALSLPYLPEVSVRKWCRYEAQLLADTVKQQGAGKIVVPAEAPETLLLPALYARAERGISLEAQRKIDNPIGWISAREIRRLLAAAK